MEGTVNGRGAQISLTLPPTKQFQGSPMFNLQAPTVGELVGHIAEALKTKDPVILEFFRASGFSVDIASAEQKVTDAGLTDTTAPSGEQQKVVGAPHIGCEHGGKLAEKSGKRGAFLGCDAFPKCRYIAGDA